MKKKLQYPIKVEKKDIRMAKYLITQYGGPNGELSASLQYLNQRYSMPTGQAKGVLTDIGTEELAHMEMIASMVYQLIKDATPQEMEAAGLGGSYAQNDNGLFWVDANGIPWSAKYVGNVGDPIADLTNNMAAEQKARATYEHLINLTDDPGLLEPLKFLREREVVHFQRFGETLEHVKEYMESKKYY